MRIVIVYENCRSFVRRFRVRSGMIHELQKMFCLYCSCMISIFMTTCRNIIYEMGTRAPCRISMAAHSHVRQTPISSCLWNHGAQFIMRCVQSFYSPSVFHTSPNPACRLWDTSFRSSEKASILVSLKLTDTAMMCCLICVRRKLSVPFQKIFNPSCYLPFSFHSWDLHISCHCILGDRHSCCAR